jgi:putative ABC transport system permease protein
MRCNELLHFALGGLWRQKIRTSLTLIGVTAGTCSLAFSLALGLGLRVFIDNEFKSRDDFWRIIVHIEEPPPDPSMVPPEKLTLPAEIAPDRQVRLREAIAERYIQQRLRKPPVPITPQTVAAFAALPDVAEVRTFRAAEARMLAAKSEKPARGLAVTGPLASLQPRLLAGRLPIDDGTKEIVVTELMLHDLGRSSDADLERALGLSVRLEVGGIRNAPPLALARALMGRLPGDELTAAQGEVLAKLVAELPTKLDSFTLTAPERAELQRLLATKHNPEEERPLDSSATATDTFVICGVVRLMPREERKRAGPLESWELARGSIFLAPTAGQHLFGQLPWAKETSLNSVDVRVRPGGDLPDTVAAIERMGYRTISVVKWFGSAQREVTMIAAGLNLFAMIALLVAAIGITNTLVTSVIERTREIGILRAVGATRTQIMALFLSEGAIIGLLGSLFGLALARGLAIPADRWVHRMIEQIAEGEKLVTPTVFVYPWWLWMSAVVFAVMVTTTAAFYPARRAARIHPIEALRYN